jgi:hypothetical protein
VHEALSYSNANAGTQLDGCSAVEAVEEEDVTQGRYILLVYEALSY